MAYYPITRTAVKSTGILLSLAAAVFFFLFCCGTRHSDAVTVTSFVGFFVGIVVFALGWLTEHPTNTAT